MTLAVRHEPVETTLSTAGWLGRTVHCQCPHYHQPPPPAVATHPSPASVSVCPGGTVFGRVLPHRVGAAVEHAGRYRRQRRREVGQVCGEPVHHDRLRRRHQQQQVQPPLHAAAALHVLRRLQLHLQRPHLADTRRGYSTGTRRQVHSAGVGHGGLRTKLRIANVRMTNVRKQKYVGQKYV